MIDIEHTTDYPQDPAMVFRALTDFADLPAWQHDVLESRLDAAEPAVGARVRQVRKVMGRNTDVELAIVEYAADAAIALETPAGTKPAVRQSYRLTALPGGGTRVEFQLRLDGVPKLAERLAKAQLGKTVPDMFGRLRDVL